MHFFNSSPVSENFQCLEVMSCENMAEQFIFAYNLGVFGGVIQRKNAWEILSLDLQCFNKPI
jgi:hypothetical protein